LDRFYAGPASDKLELSGITASPDGSVPLPLMVSYLVASIDDESSKHILMDSIKNGDPLLPLLLENPGNFSYWADLINDAIHTQTTDKSFSLREIVTNAIDAVQGESFKKEVNVEIEDGKAVIEDLGVGMTTEEVLTNLLIPLLSGKEDLDLIGRFGIGFYSVLQFLMTPEDQIIVTTTRNGMTTRVRLTGGRQTPTIFLEAWEDPEKHSGTRVEVHSSLDEEESVDLLEEKLSYNTGAAISVNYEQTNELEGYNIIEDEDVKIFYLPKRDGQTSGLLTATVYPGGWKKPSLDCCP